MSYFSQVQLNDQYGNDAEVTLLDQLKVSQNVRLAGKVFDVSGFDSNFWSATGATGGTVVCSSGESTATSSGATGSVATITSVSTARYIAANMNYFRGQIRLDSGQTGNVRQWGCGQIPLTDGLCFQLSGTTFSVVTMSGGTGATTNSGSFNGTVSAYTLDTNYHTYEIYYTMRTAKFVIDGVLIHTVSSSTGAQTQTRNFKPFVLNSNPSSSSAAANLYALTMMIARYGPPVTQPKTTMFTGTTGAILKVGPGSILGVYGMANDNNAVLTLYDSPTGATGNVLFQTGSLTTAQGMFSIQFEGSGGGMQFNNRMYATITGASANILVKYE